jgi:hypothetical protein
MSYKKENIISLNKYFLSFLLIALIYIDYINYNSFLECADSKIFEILNDELGLRVNPELLIKENIPPKEKCNNICGILIIAFFIISIFRTRDDGDGSDINIG